MTGQDLCVYMAIGIGILGIVVTILNIKYEGII